MLCPLAPSSHLSPALHTPRCSGGSTRAMPASQTSLMTASPYRMRSARRIRTVTS